LESPNWQAVNPKGLNSSHPYSYPPRQVSSRCPNTWRSAFMGPRTLARPISALGYLLGHQRACPAAKSKAAHLTVLHLAVRAQSRYSQQTARSLPGPQWLFAQTSNKTQSDPGSTCQPPHPTIVPRCTTIRSCRPLTQRKDIAHRTAHAVVCLD